MSIITVNVIVCILDIIRRVSTGPHISWHTKGIWHFNIMGMHAVEADRGWCISV